jgi:hypothetical protein
MMSVFGFSTEPSSGGDFLPIVKYDARAGRFFRVDRIDVGNGNYESAPSDITQQFKAIVDFENIEVGWINFIPGAQPDFRLVPMGQKLPDRPSTQHKNGLRFMIKLSKDIGGDKPIREVAGTSKAFLSGIEEAYIAYRNEKDKHPGQLPVLTLEKTTPITTGSGQKSSTNYKPTFKLVGWMPRGDLVHTPRGASAPQQGASAGNGAAPATGAQRAAAPPPNAGVSASDFG